MGLDEYLDKVEHREELFGPEDPKQAADEAGEPKMKNQTLYNLYSDDRFKIERKHSKELKQDFEESDVADLMAWIRKCQAFDIKRPK